MFTVATRGVISTELAEYGVIHSSFCATVLVPLLTLPMYTLSNVRDLKLQSDGFDALQFL